MITVACVLGTRPDAVKMAPVVLEFARHPELVRQVVISTGQHREMLDQVFKVFGLAPDHDLGLMRDRQTLSDLTARALSALTPVLKRKSLILLSRRATRRRPLLRPLPRFM